jgi:hypothetical protein
VGHDRGFAEKLTGPVRLTYGPCSAVEFSNGGCPVRSCNAEASCSTPDVRSSSYCRSCSTEFAAAAHRIGVAEQNVGRLDVAVQQAVLGRAVGRGLRTVEPENDWLAGSGQLAAAGQTSSPSHVPLKSVLAAGPGLVAGQFSIPSHVPLKSVFSDGPGLMAGAPSLAVGQTTIPSHVPLKSVLARWAGFVVGAEFVVGARLAAGAGVGPPAVVAGALPGADRGGVVTDGAGAATDGAGAGLAGGVELAAGGGSRRLGAVAWDELVGGVFGALLEHPPANNVRARATGTTMLRIGPSPSRSVGNFWVAAQQSVARHRRPAGTRL